MANGNFRFRSQFPIGQVASLLAAKNEREENIKAQQEQLRQQRFGNLLSAVSLGSQLATQGLNRSAVRQQMETQRNREEARQGLGQALLRQPVTSSQQFRPALSGPLSLNEQRPQALPPTRNELLGLAFQAGGAPAQAASNQIFGQGQDPIDIELQRRLTESKIQKNLRPPRQRAGQRVMSELETKAAYRRSGLFSPEEIARGQTDDGLPLPKRLTQEEADVIAPRVGGKIFNIEQKR